jgi:hypothetical protein
MYLQVDALTMGHILNRGDDKPQQLDYNNESAHESTANLSNESVRETVDWLQDLHAQHQVLGAYA